ncbi:MAG: hypothetical protein PHI90_01435 [Clostridia bacterium]|nr:hypothetical protein [Clostridia bacterium]
MTNLQFNYDGYRRPERERNMGYFPPRYYFQGYNYYSSQDRASSKSTEQNSCEDKNQIQEQQQQQQEQQQEQEIENDQILKEEIKEEIKEKLEANTDKENMKKQSSEHTEDEKEDKKNSFNVNEKLLEKLTETENSLNRFKEKADIGKRLFDDAIYKFDSIIQIIEIVRANEERKSNGVKTQEDSTKSSKDSIDEMLELLQGPVFQKVLRQLFVGMLVNK